MLKKTYRLYRLISIEERNQDKYESSKLVVVC